MTVCEVFRRGVEAMLDELIESVRDEAAFVAGSDDEYADRYQRNLLKQSVEDKRAAIADAVSVAMSHGR